MRKTEASAMERKMNSLKKKLYIFGLFKCKMISFENHESKKS